MAKVLYITAHPLMNWYQILWRLVKHLSKHINNNILMMK